MILMIDNYDSFTYNLYQYIGVFDDNIKVVRNDKITLDEIEAMQPERIVLSPGPKSPKDAGVCMDAVRRFYDKIPILGICLGHQCIGEAFGGAVSYAKELFHGKQSEIFHDGTGLFWGIDSPIRVARYHSLAVLERGLPECLKVTARTADGEIMAVEHRMFPVYGLQFHPESIYTEHGKRIIENFLNIPPSGEKQRCAADVPEIQFDEKTKRRNRMILDKIVADKKIRLTEHKKRMPFAEVRAQAERTDRERKLFYRALKKDGISIIGEFKQSSPSLGTIHSKMDLDERIEEYSASVDAVSCLTEEDHFSGNIEYLKKIRNLTKLPILRKDFMIDEYQFYEAKAIGADAVLLIAAILDDVQMKDFYRLTRELGLDALVEVHDEREMERALLLDADIIGVNNRDLKDFTIRLETTAKLSGLVPDDKVFVSESGIVTDDDVRFLKKCGADAFLIGRAFMEAKNPKELAERWKNL